MDAMYKTIELIEPTVRYVSYLSKLNEEFAGEEFNRLSLTGVYDLDINEKVYFEDALRLSLEFNPEALAVFIGSSEYVTFLVNITDEEYVAMLYEVIGLGSHMAILLLFRACYRYGKPIISDIHYDLLEKVYRTFNDAELNEVLNRSYDDDEYFPMLTGLLNVSGITTMPSKDKYISEEIIIEREKYSRDLATSKSTSIRPLTEYSELWDFISTSNADMQFSLKIDGVNCKAVFDGGELKVALSRGRGTHAKPFDYTDALLTALPHLSGMEGLDVITGEAYITEDTLVKLRSKYPSKTFKTPKSTAQSMMRASHKYSNDDLKGIRWLTFYSEKAGATADVMFSYLRECGFQCPYSIIVKREDVPKEFEEFCSWLRDTILKPMNEYSTSNEIPSDGVVCDLLEVKGNERTDHYNDTSVAIKFDAWAAATYTSTVKRLIVEQRRVYASVVAEIEPVVSRDNNVETMVNIGSLQIAVEDNIVPGKQISFMRKSEANNVYVRDGGR